MDDFDIERLDEVIHGRLRLGVMAYLSGADTADFNTLKARLKATDGNLSTHLRKLEDASYVDITKTHKGRTPITYLGLSKKGRRAFEDYMDTLRTVLGEQP